MAPWLYRTLGTKDFDDIVLHPIAELSAAGVPLINYYYVKKLNIYFENV